MPGGNEPNEGGPMGFEVGDAVRVLLHWAEPPVAGRIVYFGRGSDGKGRWEAGVKVDGATNEVIRVPVGTLRKARKAPTQQGA